MTPEQKMRYALEEVKELVQEALKGLAEEARKMAEGFAMDSFAFERITTCQSILGWFGYITDSKNPAEALTNRIGKLRDSLLRNEFRLCSTSQFFNAIVITKADQAKWMFDQFKHILLDEKCPLGTSTS